MLPPLLWILLPYLALVSFVVGHIWRYRRDRFRDFVDPPVSDGPHRLGMQAFRIGFGMVIAARLTDMVTAGPNSHPMGALFLILVLVEFIGVVAAGIGAVLLFLPDVIDAVPHTAITPLDRITMPALVAALLSGVIVRFDPYSAGDRYRTAETLFTWMRSLASLHPNAEAIRHAPVIYQVRGLVIILMVAIWPFTRLSGTFAGPVIRWARGLTRRRPVSES